MSKQYPGGLITKTPVVPSGPYETSTASGIWTLEQQAYYRKLNQWPIAGNPGPDAQFNYVTMLLHGDGTNGAQNNTFLDSSTNNFTITRNGNATQGSFSPYGANWSNYFDGTSNYLTAPNNSALSLGSETYWTVEFWAYFVTSPSDYDVIVGKGPSAYEWFIEGFSDNTIDFLYTTNGSPWAGQHQITPNMGTGSWFHVAAVRNNTTFKSYVNGTEYFSGSSFDIYSASGGVLSIGGFSGGQSSNMYLSNLRIVKGTAVYTANFTPSTTPLTAITNTSLLTCQSNRFVDNSTNNFTLTVNGTPSVQRFNPFGASTAYSTSVIGGSGYFDGAGDYLATSSTQIIPASITYTVEAWVYLTGDYSDYREIVTQGSSGNANRWLMLVNITDGILKIQTGSSSITTSFTVPKNTWTHLAFVNNGGSYTVYANGTSVGSGSNSVTPQNTYVTVGAFQSGAEYFQGYISNVRITNTAVYTSAFTPSTTPLTAISGTSLLLLTTNGAIYDNAMMNDLETVGNAQISTSVVKFGTGSMLLDGTGDYLAALNTPSSTPNGTESWTIEGWIYKTATNAFKAIYVNGYPIQIFLDTDTIEVYVARSNTADYIVSGLTGPASSITLNTWAHFAVVRNGNVYTVYVDGVGGSTTTSADAIAFPSNANATIGDAPIFGAYGYTGYIDDFRITKGYARYTANFTPPTSAFSNTGPT